MFVLFIVWCRGGRGRGRGRGPRGGTSDPPSDDALAKLVGVKIKGILQLTLNLPCLKDYKH